MKIVEPIDNDYELYYQLLTIATGTVQPSQEENMKKTLLAVSLISALTFPSVVYAVQDTVNIQGFAFNPAAHTITQGDTIVWTNFDGVSHSSTSDGGFWDSGLLSTGQSFTFVFSDAGSFPYHCTPHPSMQGTITVLALPTFDIQVDIGDFFFSPQTIQIDPGQTVRWVNTSTNISHSSTSDDAFWDSGLISPGGHFDYTFSDAGTFGYHCTPHPSMMATVEVGGGAGGCQYAVGDVNGSGGFNGLDVTYGVSYLKGGNPPTYECECVPGNTWFVTGDINGSCTYNGLDITYGVSYLKGGSGLTPCADCPPAE